MSKYFMLVFVLIAVTSNAQQTIGAQQLVAQSFWRADDPGAGQAGLKDVRDSIIVSFSGNRTAVFDPFYLTYFNFSFDPDYELFRNIYYPLSLTAMGNEFSAPLMAYDKAAYYSNGYSSSRSMLQISESIRAYNSIGDNIGTTYRSGNLSGKARDSSREVLIYQAGRPITLYSISNYILNKPLDTLDVRHYYYDTVGNRVLDSIEGLPHSNSTTVAPLQSIAYSYGTTGDLRSYVVSGYTNPGNIYKPYQKVLYSYDNADRILLREVLSLNSGSSTLQRYTLDSFDYTAGIQDFTFYRTRHFYNNGTPWPNFGETRYHVNAAGLRDTATYYTYWGDTVQDKAQRVVRYNSLNKPVSAYMYYFGGTQTVLSDSEHYYYQPIVTGITGIAPISSIFISAYPNPTTGRITINHPDLKPGTPITIFISNTAGQAVHAESLISTGTKTEMTLGDEAPPGIYNIRISAGSGAALYTGTLLKL